ALNKKVLCFIDEYGTAGAGELSLGAVLVLARDAGRVDRCFTGLLEANANEIHAAAMDDGYLQGLLRRFWDTAPAERLVMVNQKIGLREGPGPVLYAQAVVETVKIGLKRFQKDVLGRETIGNVEVITDQNHQNDHEDFRREIERSQEHDGRFKGVKRVVTVDSAASRLLQLADVVGYARKWVDEGAYNAVALREQFGIQMP
ncbi:MAG TPA: DUF3800 domain-containing protein, partial [Caulobacteraceae bacterium]|nr:DUF3800 domain-containing protein [Caulobacteraceae bacterium]